MNDHIRGQIIGGACWDLWHKSGMSANYVNGLVYEVVENLPWLDSFGGFMEDLLVADDNDGNIFNGTPHQDQIFSAFNEAHWIMGDYVAGTIHYNTSWSGSTILFLDDVTVPSGIALTIASGVGVGLNGYYLKSTGGTITDNGATWQPKDIAVKDGSTLKGHYSTIQSAIDAASSGQTVWVAPGTYSEQLFMKDGVSLEGTEGGTPTVCGGPSGTAATFYNIEDADVKNIRFTGSNSLVEISGVDTDVYFEDVEVDGDQSAGLGVYIGSSADPTFSDVIIHTCSSKGVHSSDAYGYIYSSDIHSNGQGVYCSSNSEPELSGGNNFYLNSSYDVHATSDCPTLYAEYCNWDSTDENGPTRVLHDGEPTYTIQVFGWSGYPKLAATFAQKPDQGWEWYVSAKEKLKRGDLRGALEDFKRIVGSSPHTDVGRFALNRTVLVHGKLREYANAIAYLEQIAAEHEGEEIGVRALFLTGRCLIAQEKYPEALARCDLVLSRYPASEVCPSALIEKAGVYLYGLGDEAKGKELFAEVAARFPDSDEAEFARYKLGIEQRPKLPAEEDEPASTGLAVYPNPSNPSTTIQFNLPDKGKVSLTIHNVLGQQVAILVDGRREPGTHVLVWHGRDAHGFPLGSGLYFVRLETPESAVTKRMILLK